MKTNKRSAPAEAGGYDAVRMALSRYNAHDTVSTKHVLQEARFLSPNQIATDDEMTSFLVEIATERRIGIIFDQR